VLVNGWEQISGWIPYEKSDLKPKQGSSSKWVVFPKKKNKCILAHPYFFEILRNNDGLKNKFKRGTLNLKKIQN
jgi:hypothetical protein